MAYNDINIKIRKSTKDTKNFSKENSISESEDKTEYIGKILIDFNEKEKNPKLDEMISDLINYRKECENFKEKNNKQPPSNTKSLLFQYLEKNLIELSCLKNKEILENRINILFYWYKDQNKRHEELKYMIMKTYKEKDEVDEEEYLLEKLKKEHKDIEEPNPEIKINHRNNLADKKMLSDYTHKTIINSKIEGGNVINPRKSITNDEKNNNINNNENNDIKILDSKLINQEFFDGDFSQFYSEKYGTNYFSLGKEKINKDYFEKAPGTCYNFNKSFVKNNDGSLFPPLNHETKFSYSYNRPEYHYQILSVEKEIIQNKMERLSEQRTQNEIINKINEFGLQRAKYKENLNNKYELKNVINMYVNSNKYKFQSPLLERYKIVNKNQKFINNSNNKSINGKRKNTESQKNLTSFTNEDFVSFSSKKILPVPKKKTSNIDTNTNLDSETKRNRKKNFSLRKSSRNQSVKLVPTKIIINFSGVSSKEKIQMDKIKNIDSNNKNIIEKKDDIKKFKLKMKLINENKKIHLSSSQKNFYVPPDAVAKLIANDSLYKEKRTYEKLCNINMNQKNNNNNVSTISNGKSINSKSQEESETDRYNYVLSAYDQKNIKKINGYRNINENIKTPINNAKYKINRLHNTFNLCKNNLLNLRRTMSDWKKNDYNLLVNKMAKNFDNGDESYNDRDYLFRNNSVGFLTGKNSLVKNIKLRKEKSLLNAMINPNDNITYSRFFLPRSGSMLLSRKENQNTKKK